MYHIFVECIGSTRSTHLRLKLNNVYRKYHPVTTPSDDYTTVESLHGLLDDETETIRQEPYGTPAQQSIRTPMPQNHDEQIGSLPIEGIRKQKTILPPLPVHNQT